MAFSVMRRGVDLVDLVDLVELVELVGFTKNVIK